MTVGSLCSGYEGLGMAVEAVTNDRIVWQAENDLAASRVLAHRYPGIPNLGDLTAVDWSAVEPVDVLAAGFPCQPISQAGRRKVTNDARWLWPHIANAVRVLRPRLVVLENVPPLLRPWRDDDGWWNPAPIEEVAGDLAGLGYLGRWRCVRASDVGAPHRRERVFVAAVHADHVGREGGQPWALRHAGRGHRLAADAVCSGAGRDGRAVPRAPESTRLGADVHAAVDARATAAHPDGCQRRGERDTECGDRPTADARRGAPESGGCSGAPADPDLVGFAGFAQLDSTPQPELDRKHRGHLDRRVVEDVRGAGLGEDQHGGRSVWGPYGPAIRRWEHLTRPAPPPQITAGD